MRVMYLVVVVSEDGADWLEDVDARNVPCVVVSKDGADWLEDVEARDVPCCCSW